MGVTIQRIGVVGAGTMGSGIAQVFAQAGLDVRLSDSVPAGARSRARGDREEPGEARRERHADRRRPRRRASRAISTTGSLDPLGEVDFVVEAVAEDLEVKVECSRSSTPITRPGVVLASNTSSISITVLGAVDEAARQSARHALHEPGAADEARRADPRPGDVGRVDDDRDRAVHAAREDAAVEAADYPGFIANRILMPMINEAIYTLMEGVGTPEAIDSVMKLGMNHPMGPLTLADFIGLDVCLAILNVLHDGLGDPKYRPCPLLRRMVAAGYLGKKERPRLLHLLVQSAGGASLLRYTRRELARTSAITALLFRGPETREIQDHRPARQRRVRYRLPRPGHLDRQEGRDQGSASAGSRLRRAAARAAAARLRQPPQHRRHHDRGEAGQRLLHRHGIRGG